MNKAGYTSFFVLFIVLVGTVGCKQQAVIDWQSQTEKPSVSVNNPWNADFVIFKDTLAKENIIGGIRMKESSHGITNLEGEIVLRFVPHEEVLENMNDLSKCEETYSELVTTRSAPAAPIPVRIRGGYEVTFINETGKDVAIHLGDWTGKKIISLPKNVRTNKIYVDREECYFYPVYHVTDEKGAHVMGRLDEVIARFLQEDMTLTVTRKGEPTHVVSYAVISNAFPGAVLVFNGMMPLYSQRGLRVLPPGSVGTYEVPGGMEKGKKNEDLAIQVKTRAPFPEVAFTNGLEYHFTIDKHGSVNLTGAKPR